MDNEINKALETLRNGGIIIYPTDTVWGIGCDATNTEAVKKIYTLKQREDSKSLITLVNGERMIHRMFKEVPETAWQILDYSDKPTTLILDHPQHVAPNLIAADKSLGIRWVKDSFCSKLIERLKNPLVSTSANFSGQPTPRNFKEIDSELLKGADYVVNWRQNEETFQKPSTIIKLTLDNQVKIIRH
jgi:L-threonylcarbamoyladenylate synthase